MMKMIIWFLRISVFAILAVFASQNSQPVVLQYYLNQSIELPLSAVMLAFFALGIFITIIFTYCRFRSEK
ncbi:LapA family protein [Nitrosomonas sp. PY1]|uniref:LapA family protein n=1 Tax=Nitrosomonas sp. PY1 TaxID=1803906 RepID=UPI00283A9686|nr:LapA family protein [Nitrosomonas sp. PY1]